MAYVDMDQQGQTLADALMNAPMGDEAAPQTPAPSAGNNGLVGWMLSTAMALGVNPIEFALAFSKDPNAAAAATDSAVAQGAPVTTPPSLIQPSTAEGATDPAVEVNVSLPINEEVQPGMSSGLVPPAPPGIVPPGVPLNGGEEPTSATTVAASATDPAQVAAASPTGNVAPADILSGVKMPVGPQQGAPPAAGPAPRPQLQPSELDALIGAVMAKGAAGGQAGLTLGTQLRRT